MANYKVITEKEAKALRKRLREEGYVQSPERGAYYGRGRSWTTLDRHSETTDEITHRVNVWRTYDYANTGQPDVFFITEVRNGEFVEY